MKCPGQRLPTLVNYQLFMSIYSSTEVIGVSHQQTNAPILGLKHMILTESDNDTWMEQVS